MKCKNEACVNEAKGRSNYCCDTCKTVYNRNKSVTESVTVTQTVTRPLIPGDDVADDVSDLTEYPLTATALDSLPPGVTQPTGAPNDLTNVMSAQSLSSCVSTYKGLDWIASPEYAETILRLLTRTPEQLQEQGQWVPAWKEQAA